jgi:hypothetical protein
MGGRVWFQDGWYKRPILVRRLPPQCNFKSPGLTNKKYINDELFRCKPLSPMEQTVESVSPNDLHSDGM